MDERLQAAETALLFLDDNEMVQLGAMLGLQAQLGRIPVEDVPTHPAPPLGFDA